MPGKEVICLAIKPVDFQVMIPRTMEASRVINDETQRNQAMQYQQAANVQHRAEDSLKHVYARPQAQDARINEKQKDSRQNGGNKKKKNGRNVEENESAGKNRLNNGIRTSTIDIKI